MKLKRNVIDASWDNMNDVLEAMTNEGQKSLDIYEKNEDKVILTHYGCILKLKNSKGKGFYALVMDTDDTNVFRRRIVRGAESIKKNFKELI